MAIPQPIEAADGSLIVGLRRAQTAGADIILVVGGGAHHSADPLRAALRDLGVCYVAGDVQVRPGAPMLLATVATPAGGRTLLAGLPGRPQPAVAALLTLVTPAIDGLAGRSLPDLSVIELGAPITGRGPHTRLAPVRRGCDGRGYPVRHTAYAMLHGLARSAAFAVIAPYRMAAAGARVPVLPLSAGPPGPARD
jgi:molybdopterin molybdotransferase